MEEEGLQSRRGSCGGGEELGRRGCGEGGVVEGELWRRRAGSESTYGSGRAEGQEHRGSLQPLQAALLKQQESQRDLRLGALWPGLCFTKITLASIMEKSLQTSMVCGG